MTQQMLFGVTVVSRSWGVVCCAIWLLVQTALGAQGTAPGPEFVQPENRLLRWTIVALGFIAIWVILYKAVYPKLLRYYRDDFCKTIFWTLLWLYVCTWALLASFIVLEIGFYYGWLKWAAAFFAALWLIAGMSLLLRRNPA